MAKSASGTTPAPADTAWIGAPVAALLNARACASDTSLAGATFAVKDNIDCAGFPTTAGCPAFAYSPAEDAAVVARLKAAGARVAGKTNLDQFATGLVGVRSPYGAVANPFNAQFIAGGSSSGSASVVARGLVDFALGTDTAGSGRIPAGFCNIVGLKPTRGALSSRGVVPACRSLDCVSIFALSARTAGRVWEIAAGHDPRDPYSRRLRTQSASFGVAPRFGIPVEPEFCGDEEARVVFEEAVDRLAALGVGVERVDLRPFHAAGELLYEGPWIAERLAAVGEFLQRHPEAVDPAVRAIVERGAAFSAVDAFRAQYRLEVLRRESEAVWSRIDALFLPTAPTIYRIAEIGADPIVRNANLGFYTNFVNLLDFAAIALPAGFRNDGLPHGITVVAPAWTDRALVEFGERWQHATALPLGATDARLQPWGVSRPQCVPGTVRIAVVGAHLRGLALNHQLVERRAGFAGEARTAPAYRLHALARTDPPKPGLARCGNGRGASILLELWDVPEHDVGSFVAQIPPPLGIGSIELDDGTWVKGFLCETHALEGARDISAFGGWRGYLASLAV